MTTPTQQESSLVMLQALLKQWGLESLGSTVSDMLTNGDTADVIPIKLRETDAYKTRFKGNLDRIAAGLPALSEAEYLTTETALKAVVRRYVGAGTYDTKDQLDKWMSADLSPQELNDRMGLYADRYQSTSQTAVQRPDGSWTTVGAMWASHGLTPQDAIVALMDPKVDETTLKRQSNIYALGAQSVNAFHNDSVLNQDLLGSLADRGVEANAATQKNLQDVAGRTGYESMLAKGQSVDLTQEDQLNAGLADDARAEAKRQQVIRTDQAKFNENYLGGVNTLNRNRSGSY